VNMDLLTSLPPSTHVYCGHEYTLTNIEFLRSVAPRTNNTQLQKAIKTYHSRAVALRKEKLPTVPSTIGDELAYNLFAKCRELDVQRAVDCIEDPIGTMRALRELKNNF